MFSRYKFANIRPMEKAYNHKVFEDEIYKKWEGSGAFTPKIPKELPSSAKATEGLTGSQANAVKKPFVISMPPPNVTGKLHIGHGMYVTLEDIMIRYNRMKGVPSLWIPGTDHAGIATQNVVEKQLAKEGLRRGDLGREKFVERVWQWKEEYGSAITGQIRKIGASCDWTRERFTLDKGLTLAVNEAFVDFYKKGLIYRGEYIVNWCPKCSTAISDDEVEHKAQPAKLYFFKYDKAFPITIATTRPETKLGDTGIAVNSSDPRYKEYVGKEFKINLDGVKRKIKVFADRTIDKEFGTGAVGVTPAHSMTDWRLAEQYELEKIKIIDEHGRITNTNDKYDGLKVSEAREKILDYLKSEGLLEKEEEFENNLSICYRCGGSIEPLPSLQWFVKMKPLAEKAKKAVKDGEIKIMPERFEKVYFHWMENIHDWCISRQLWWGHRIPVWYRKQEISNDEREIYVGTTPPKDGEWEQDPDVLDTWFSSGLWPFSTLGWPKETDDFKYFYPTTVMETGYDILFFWVARMIMMGLELTGKAPFETVYLHGLVRDEKNRKMSKSLGNVIDPIDIIDKYGADALRYSLIVGSTPGQDIALGESKIRGYRNFSNKIWNISRFVVTNLESSKGENDKLKDRNCHCEELDPSFCSGQAPQSTQISRQARDDTAGSDCRAKPALSLSNGLAMTQQDKMDLSRLDEIIKQVSKLLDELKFSQAGEILYDYTWHEFADKIIEQEKERLYGEDEQEKKASLLKLSKILVAVLKMLHPYMPFVTEAAWSQLPEEIKDSKLLICAPWPE